MVAVVTPPRASTDLSAARYHVLNPAGNHIQIREIHTRTVAGVQVTYLEITNGGDSIVLSQTNALDLAAALTNFGTNGVLS